MDYVIKSHKELGSFFESLKTTDVIGFDIEATGLDFISDSILSLQVSTPNDTFVFTNKEMFKYISSLISGKEIIGHNLKFDMRFIYYKYGVLFNRVYDTMIINAVLNAGINGFSYSSLNNLLEKYFDVTLDKDIRDKFINANELDSEMIKYASEDVKYLIPLYHAMNEKLAENKLINIAELEMKLLPVVVVMETIGINLDIDSWLSIAENKQKAYVETEQKLKKLLVPRALSKISYNNLYDALTKFGINIKTKRDTNFYKSIEPTDPQFFELLYANINMASNKQLLTILSILGFELTSTSKTALNEFETKNKLTDFQKEVIELIRDFRENYKRANSFGQKYIDKYVKSDGKLHAEFNQMGTATGRFSSSNPNLQQVPHTQDYRSCFVASPGYKMITADYSQMELRIMAAVSNETKMIEAYKNGEDLHKLTASIIFSKPVDEITKEERNAGKRINFAVIYGAGAYRIANTLDIPLDEAERIYNKLHEGYNNMYSFIELAGEKIYELGFSKTILGRKRFFTKPLLYQDNRERKKIESSIKREGVNHIIQGTGADIVKLAMIEMFYNNPWGTDKFRILLQVHDEVVVEVSEDIAKEAKEYIVNVMKNAECKVLNNKVPCEVDSHLEDYWVK